jgi:hypothetical protein
LATEEALRPATKEGLTKTLINLLRERRTPNSSPFRKPGMHA